MIILKERFYLDPQGFPNCPIGAAHRPHGGSDDVRRKGRTGEENQRVDEDVRKPSTNLQPSRHASQSTSLLM